MADRSLSNAIRDNDKSEGSLRRGRVPLRTRILIVAPSSNLPAGQSNHAAQLRTELGKEARLAVSFVPLNPRPPIVGAIKYLRTLAASVVYCGNLMARVPFHDVVHVYSASTSSFFISSMPAILIAKLFGRKVVLNYHSGRAEEQLRRWRRTTVPLMRLVDAIAVPSSFLAQAFARHGLVAKVITNHVEAEKFRFRERRSLQPVFFSNRHFHEVYNVQCVLRAFALIQRDYPEARLVLAGDGPQREAIQSLARSLALKNLKFAGLVAPERMPELYDAADVYLNASNVDNMPLSILEAFAAGLPVVTTNPGGIPYLVAHERTGLLVAMNDHAALAKAAVRLLEDPQLAATIARRAHLECDRYSWSKVRGEWLRLYEDIVAGERAAESPAPD